LCDEMAITFQTDHMCPPGFYCPIQATEPLPCAAGTFRPSPGAQGIEECYTCPEGFFCPREENNMTSLATNATNAAGDRCTNFGSITPFMCPVGSYCPVGASLPTLCPLGYAASVTSGPRSSIANACTICSAGTFGAHPQRLECAPSAPGFVCLEGCKSETPSDLTRDKGYVCPVGHYCPTGSTRELTCGIGEFNKVRGASNVTACMLCAPNTYNDRVGQGVVSRARLHLRQNKVLLSANVSVYIEHFSRSMANACVSLGTSSLVLLVGPWRRLRRMWMGLRTVSRSHTADVPLVVH
jgi:hypothetical protein